MVYSIGEFAVIVLAMSICCAEEDEVKDDRDDLDTDGDPYRTTKMENDIDLDEKRDHGAEEKLAKQDKEQKEKEAKEGSAQVENQELEMKFSNAEKLNITASRELGDSPYKQVNLNGDNSSTDRNSNKKQNENEE